MKLNLKFLFVVLFFVQLTATYSAPVDSDMKIIDDDVTADLDSGMEDSADNRLGKRQLRPGNFISIRVGNPGPIPQRPISVVPPPTVNVRAGSAGPTTMSNPSSVDAMNLGNAGRHIGGIARGNTNPGGVPGESPL